jgi:hypothetical protein
MFCKQFAYRLCYQCDAAHRGYNNNVIQQTDTRRARRGIPPAPMLGCWDTNLERMQEAVLAFNTKFMVGWIVVDLLAKCYTLGGLR